MDEAKQITELPTSGLKSKRFALPVVGIGTIAYLVRDTAYVREGCYLVAIIAVGGLAAEFYLKLRNKWNGKKKPDNEVTI